MKPDEREYTIRFKPLTIVFRVEREALFKELKAQKEEVDLMIENPDLDVKTKLKAYDVSLKLAKAMAGILDSGETRQINETLDQLKKDVKGELARRKREDNRRMALKRLRMQGPDRGS